MNPHDLHNLHFPGDDIEVGPTANKKHLRGRKGKFIRYSDAEIEVDGKSVYVTTKNVLKTPCSKCEPHN